MRRARSFAVVVVAVASVGTTAACKSCDVRPAGPGDGGDDPAVAEGPHVQPTMPEGMLLPGAGGGGGASGEGGSDRGASGGGASAAPGVRTARRVKAGPYAELQPAAAGDRPSRRDLASWSDASLFVSLEAMALLHEAFARALPGFDLFVPRLLGPDALRVLAGELAPIERAGGPAASAAREVAAYADELAKQQRGLWVLTP